MKGKVIIIYQSKLEKNYNKNKQKNQTYQKCLKFVCDLFASSGPSEQHYITSSSSIFNHIPSAQHKNAQHHTRWSVYIAHQQTALFKMVLHHWTQIMHISVSALGADSPSALECYSVIQAALTFTHLLSGAKRQTSGSNLFSTGDLACLSVLITHSIRVSLRRGDEGCTVALLCSCRVFSHCLQSTVC